MGQVYNEEGSKLLRGLPKGECIILEREYRNKYDCGSVAVYVPRDQKSGLWIRAGYIPRDDARDLSELMDYGGKNPFDDEIADWEEKFSSENPKIPEEDFPKFHKDSIHSVYAHLLDDGDVKWPRLRVTNIRLKGAAIHMFGE